MKERLVISQRICFPFCSNTLYHYKHKNRVVLTPFLTLINVHSCGIKHLATEEITNINFIQMWQKILHNYMRDCLF